MEHQHHSNESRASADSKGFPELFELRRNLERQGEDPFDAKFWMPQVFGVAADILKVGGIASRANREAMLVMLAISMSESQKTPDALDLSIAHRGGTTGSAYLQFSPLGEIDTLVPRQEFSLEPLPDNHHRQVWVSPQSVVVEDLGDVVLAFAEHQGVVAGHAVSLIGAGATLALFQSLDWMGAKSNDARVTGWGTPEHQVDALFQVRLGGRMKPRPKAGPRF